ncbi:MAG: hypothetical protein ABI528_07075 [bacterium]
MKKLVVCLILFTAQLQAQEDYVHFEKTTHIATKKNNLNDFPFRFGIEGGFPLKLNSISFISSAFFIYLKASFSKNLLYLKLEYGRASLNKELGNNIGYGGIGLGANIFNIGKLDKVFLEFGFGIYSKKKEILEGGPKVSLIYIHNVSKLINIFVSAKLAVI